MVKDKIIKLFGEKKLRRSAIRGDGWEMPLCAILSVEKPHTLLEIGTHHGCSAAWLSQFCDVITVDIEDKGQFEMWEALEIKNVRGYVLKPEEVHPFVLGQDFDMAFIDGAHDPESVMADFDAVKKCGRVIFHDYIDKPGMGVFALVNTLSKVTIMKNYAYWNGLN